MRVTFGHHLSLSYRGGGEKWLTQLANELALRGHEVTIRCLPFWKRDNPIELLPEIDYKEGYFHHLDGDVVYITYNPLSWLNFKTKSPKIGGIHSHCYWQPLDYKYGLLPNLANVVHAVTNKWELGKFKAIHTVTPIYPISHDNVYFIPNFVDGNEYKPFPKDDEFTVGYSSRKVWQKGWDIFLKLQELMDDIKFAVTNNTPEAQMPKFHSRNHVTVVPARVDTFGLVNVESMLCGTPVVSSGLPTHKALELPIRYAYRIEEYITEIETLQEMFKAGMYDTISQTCRDSALKYDKDLVIDKLENMFKEVSKCE